MGYFWRKRLKDDPTLIR